jgi:glycosyltransferase involved in cell wall biosynthesis
MVARLIHQSNSDIVHANSTTAHLVSGIAASRLDLPAIWHARDLINLGRGSQFLSSRAAAVIAISGCVAESLQRQGVAPEKIHLIRNGIEPDHWKPDLDAPRRLRLKLKWDGEFVFAASVR